MKQTNNTRDKVTTVASWKHIITVKRDDEARDTMHCCTALHRRAHVMNERKGQEMHILPQIVRTW